jgi:hypothetical protein
MRAAALRGTPSRTRARPRTPASFVDRTVIADSSVARISDYVALLRDLAALGPREALAQFDLDDASYREIAARWAAAIADAPELAAMIELGLERAANRP